MNKDIYISNLAVSFPVSSGLVRALKKTSIAIKKNAITGLIGESGCGKSVLGMAIMNLLPSNAKISGEVSINSKNIFNLPVSESRYWRAKTFAIIPQNPEAAFNPVRKINVQVIEALWSLQLSQGEITQKMQKIFIDFGLNDFERIWHSYPFQLSGGMQQKILCSISIAGQNDWIVADEPTKGLDHSSLAALKENLLFTKNKNNSGMLVITHDVNLASSLCDTIVVMYAGEIVEIGSNVVQNPQHPYTKAFIEALPENGFKYIPGTTPDALSLNEGCAFAPRCSQYTDRCCKENPPFYDAQISSVRCFLYD